jgi:tetratricopeptide (TPR) repeat protein
MAEEIINALVRIEGLRVTSRTSAFQFKSMAIDSREIGRRLGVTTLLEGSVRKTGGRIRITAQLIDVADGYHLWSKRYDRKLEDVFAIQDEIAGNIAETLKVTLGSNTSSRHERPPADVEAYDWYLRGRQLLHRLTRKTGDLALQMFQRAIEIDPAYARGHAGVADCYAFRVMYGGNREEDRLEADEASKKALELDPDSAEALAARGLALSLGQHYEEAERQFQAAIRLNPRLFEAHYFFARMCYEQGNLEEAARLFDRAAEVNPDDFRSRYLLSQTYRGLGRGPAAEAAARKVLPSLERYLERNPDDGGALSMGAATLVVLGERERAFKWIELALATDPKESLILYNAACVLSLGGELERAIDCLAEIRRRQPASLHTLRWWQTDSDLDPLRGHLRFQAIIEEMERAVGEGGSDPDPD